MPNEEFRILSPTAILGYGFPEESFQLGIAKRPHLIACDAGSTDPGPYYLGSGKSFTNRTFVRRDLRYMLVEGLKLGIPIVVGTAGGSGAGPHLAWCRAILEEIAQEEKLSFCLGVITADIEKEKAKAALRQGKISPMPFAPELTEDAIDASCHLVAQMGSEPLIRAFKAGCQVILAGRCYDPAVFASLPIMLGYDPGLAIHLGKILECGAIAATPGSGADCAFGTLTGESFILEALSPVRNFTRESAAAHTLYEKSDPYHLPGPGGVLHLEKCCFTELHDGRVEVRGSRYESTSPYRVKLEGARKAGFRSVSIAGSRDPIFIAKIDEILASVRTHVSTMMHDTVPGSIIFHVYGKDAVMGPTEPEKHNHAHEIGIVIEAVAPTPEAADTLLSVTRSTLLHYGYPGRISTAGNLAFPFSPSDILVGDVFEFSVYHLMEIDHPADFPLEIVKFTHGSIES